MATVLSTIFIIFGTASLVLAIINIIQESKRIIGNWYFLFLGIFSFIWSMGMSMFIVQNDSEGALFWRTIYLIGVMGLIIMFGLLVGIWLNIPNTIRKIANIYYVIGGVITYPLIIQQACCEFKLTDHGMSYCAKDCMQRIIYNIYLIGFILLISSEMIYCIVRRLKKREVVMAKSCIAVLVIIVTGLFFDTFTFGGEKPVIPVSALVQSSAVVFAYFMSKKTKINIISVQDLSDYIFESVSVPIIIIDEKHQLKICNKRAINFFGIQYEQLKKKKIEELFTISEEEKEKLNQDPIALEGVCTQNQRVCKLEISHVKDNYNEYISHIVIVNDITDTYRILEETHAAKEEAIRANNAKSAFLANMSHEIRTPMNSIIGMSEILLRNEKDSEKNKKIWHIYNAGMGLLGIINDILDITKIESGKYELIDEKYEFDRLLYDVLSLIKMKITNENVELKYEVGANVPSVMYGDANRIKQILINILGNAVKFTKEGFISFYVDSVNLQDNKCKIIFKVSDTGIGIKEEDYKKLFEVFMQVDTKKNRNIKGTGLGLPIAKNLSELMNGNIAVESVYGEGTTFTITIEQTIIDDTPLVFSKNLDDRDDIKKNLFAPAYDERMNGKNVLIVDDNATNLLIARGLLEPYNINIDTATSGDEAIELIKKNTYSIIFMDYMMPHKDGIETTREIRGLDIEYCKNVPIVALTANALASAKKELMAAGFDNYITKPIDVRRLEDVLYKYLTDVKTKDSNNESGNAESVISIEDIDVIKAMNQMNATESIYINVLRTYVKDLQEILIRIESMDIDKQIKDFVIDVHSVKSASAGIGAFELSDLARELEMAGKENNLIYIGDYLEEFVNKLRKMIYNIREFLDKQEVKDVRKEEEVQSQVIDEKWFNDMTDACEYMNSTSITELVNSVKYGSENAKYSEMIEKIEEYANQYEFDEIISLLRDASQ